MALGFNRRALGPLRRSLGNLLRDHIEVGGWSPKGPRRVTVRDRRPRRGGTLDAMLTLAKDRPVTAHSTGTRNGARVQAGHDHRGRFVEGSFTVTF